MTDLTRDVELLLHVNDQIAELTAQAKEIKQRIAAQGVGTHQAGPVAVVVRPPNRTFNLERGWSMLSPEQQTVCLSPDAKKVKAQLPETLIDACMDPGKGDPVVSVK